MLVTCNKWTQPMLDKANEWLMWFAISPGFCVGEEVGLKHLPHHPLGAEALRLQPAVPDGNLKFGVPKLVLFVPFCHRRSRGRRGGHWGRCRTIVTHFGKPFFWGFLFVTSFVICDRGCLATLLV